MGILEELAKIARTRPEKLKEQKEKGVKIVGYVGRFVPEEPQITAALGAAILPKSIVSELR
ncbi:MAG: hypothetical protein OEZ07_02150 [Dehalococcoidia bacterium]|nr:hypothetical protein [Dehalococcoidia bacterium]MDH5781360.1 hypothetical protein [Dehalococcoidia bacterium]